MRSLTISGPPCPDVVDVKSMLLQTLQAELQGARREIGQDQLVALEGAPRERIIGVSAGLLRCFRITPDGRRHITRFVGPGGLIGLGTHPTYRNSAEAVIDSSLIVFQAHTMDAGMETFYAFNERFDGKDCSSWKPNEVWGEARSSAWVRTCFR